MPVDRLMMFVMAVGLVKDLPSMETMVSPGFRPGQRGRVSARRASARAALTL